MTAAWVMVYMICVGRCEAQYAIPYETRGECVRHIPKKEGMRLEEKYVCIPTTKD